METKPRSRAKAKIAGSKLYFTGKPCKRGHMSGRRTVNGHCIACTVKYHVDNREAIAESKAKYYKENREAILESQAKYSVANREAIAARKAEYYANNWEAKAEYEAKYYADNREAIAESRAKYRVENREAIAESSAKHRSENPGARNESHKWSKYLKLGRTMPWSDREAIQTIYKRCAELTAETGIPHHVDHHYPINGATVSGLHVADNLHPIPATENQRKFNKHPDEIAQ